MDPKKVFEKAKRNAAGLRFEELQQLALSVGYRLKRTKGSHFMYEREGTFELLNSQEDRGKAKPYQVKQLLRLIERYNWDVGD